MARDKKLKARVLKKERVFDDFFKMDKLTIEFERHGGGMEVVERLNFERGDAVAILSYDPGRDLVLLGNEMRNGMIAAGDYPFEDALMAGGIEKGETALRAARREIKQEGGNALRLSNLLVIHKGAYTSPGGTSERIALVFGTVDMSKAGGVHGLKEEQEDIKSAIITGKEFIRRAQAGEIKDLKTLTVAFWFALNRDKLRKEFTPRRTSRPAPAARPNRN
jgi:ADP-ribose pyrophosphatase